MAYTEILNTNLKQFYCPYQIIIDTPPELSYSQFRITIKMQKRVVNVLTNETISSEYCGDLTRLLSEINPAVVAAVEAEVAAIMQASYGNSEPGPIPTGS